MAGAATATYTTEAFMSPGMNGSQHWDYAVPIGPEVGFVLFFILFLRFRVASPIIHHTTLRTLFWIA